MSVLGLLAVLTVTVVIILNWTFTMTGTLLVNSGCSNGRSFNFQDGTSVTVYNDSGTVVAEGNLGRPQQLGGTSCLFPFTVNNVPIESKFYVEVSNTGKVMFTAGQAEHPYLFWH